MSKRTATASLAALALGIGGLWTASTATAAEHDHEIPRHSHMLLLGADLQFGPGGEPQVSYRKCIDLAHNRALKLNAHHEHVHFGRAGEALRAAGHLIVPTAPAFGLPWDDCAEFTAMFPSG